jgi:predicted transcriptional regulator
MKQTMTIRLAQEQIIKLREIAKAEDRSLSAVIRRFVDEGIKKKTDTRKT